SAKELGLGADHACILELDTTAAPGTRFIDALGIADHQIVIDVPANRPDLLCHKGVARELGASIGAVVKLPAIPGGPADSRTAGLSAIFDAEHPTVVAGVMGSAESDVSADTRDLVLECAYFQPTRIRRTRRALELSSESSYRFERGIDQLGMPDALRRAIELIIAVAGGEVRAPALDLWPEPQQERTIFLRPERVNHLLGVAIERPEV